MQRLLLAWCESNCCLLSVTWNNLYSIVWSHYSIPLALFSIINHNFAAASLSCVILSAFLFWPLGDHLELRYFDRLFGRFTRSLCSQSQPTLPLAFRTFFRCFFSGVDLQATSRYLEVGTIHKYLSNYDYCWFWPPKPL